MFRSAFVVGLFASCAATVAADEKTVDALKALQGEWKVEKVAVGGEQIPLKKVATSVMTFKADKMIPNDDPKDPATVKLDPAQKPAQIDLTRGEIVTRGIYELTGDALKVCLAPPGEKRPTEFDSAKGSKNAFIVLKKAGK